MQPDEGVSLSLGAKIPGDRACGSARSTWSSGTAPASCPSRPEAYERLILDAMRGDASLFTREDEVRGLLGDLRPDPEGVGRRTGPAAELSRPGRPGPVEADALLRGLVRRWRPI